MIDTLRVQFVKASFVPMLVLGMSIGALTIMAQPFLAEFSKHNKMLSDGMAANIALSEQQTNLLERQTAIMESLSQISIEKLKILRTMEAKQPDARTDNRDE